MEEYIKRKDVLDVFGKYMFAGYRGNGKSFFSEIVMPTFYRAIEELPSEDVRENIHGEWIDYDDDYGSLMCSICEKDSPDDIPWDFCPNCGANMKGETE